MGWTRGYKDRMNKFVLVLLMVAFVHPLWTQEFYAHSGIIHLTGPVVSLTRAYRFAPHWGLRVSRNPVTTGFHRDTNVFMGGISYRFYRSVGSSLSCASHLYTETTIKEGSWTRSGTLRHLC